MTGQTINSFMQAAQEQSWEIPKGARSTACIGARMEAAPVHARLLPSPPAQVPDAGGAAPANFTYSPIRPVGRVACAASSRILSSVSPPVTAGGAVMSHRRIFSGSA